jgi:hypothetical protein
LISFQSYSLARTLYIFDVLLFKSTTFSLYFIDELESYVEPSHKKFQNTELNVVVVKVFFVYAPCAMGYCKYFFVKSVVLNNNELKVGIFSVGGE